jgi:type I restriction enzyme S subunit
MRLTNLAESDSLPEGWSGTRLGETGFVRLGKTPHKSDYRDEGKHRIIKFRDLRSSELDFTSTKAGFVADNPRALRGLRSLSLGDILVTASAHSGDQIGKKCAHVHSLPDAEGGVFFVGELLGVTVDRQVLLDKWLYYWFLSDAGIKAVQGAVAGVHLTCGRAQAILLPVAPLSEQRRIVTKIEEGLNHLKTLSDHLVRVPTILGRFRRSVLHAACSGGLSRDLRTGLDCTQQNRNVNEKTIESDNFFPWKLPEGWQWRRLSDCAKVQRGRFSIRPRNNPEYYGGQYPFVQIGDLPTNGGEITNYRQTLNHKGLAVSKLFQKGTVLVAIVGATIGNTGVLTFDSCCPDSLVAIQATTVAMSRFIEYYLTLAKLTVRNYSYASGGQPNINLQTLLPLLVPIPSSQKEVEVIVHRADLLLKLGSRIEEQVLRASTRSEQLRQAILRQAFNGKLAPTEAELARREGRDYEPASVLLERMKERRKAMNGAKPNKPGLPVQTKVTNA